MKRLLFTPRVWTLLIAALVVFGGLFTMQWFGKKMMNQAMDNAGLPTVTVTSAFAETATWQPSILAVGTARAIQGAELSTEVSGIVEKVEFDNGADVKAGDVIVALNSETDQAELASLRAAERLAEIEAERAKKLLEQRSLSESEADRRETELDQARANVKAQEARIEQKTVRAPYAGRLGIRKVNVGDYVAAGDPIISLQSLNPLYVDFTLPEQYAQDVGQGTLVQVQVDALRGEQFEGQVTAVAPAIDPDTRNFAVQATVANPEQRLKPGMFASLRVPLGDDVSQVIIPQTAISYRPYGNSVYVIGDDNTVAQRFVTLGDRRGDMIAVTKGLEAGAQVATSAILKLRSGTPVNIDNSVTPDASLQPTPENG